MLKKLVLEAESLQLFLYLEGSQYFIQDSC